MSSRAGFWTDEDLGYLSDSTLTVGEIAHLTGRSPRSVSNKRWHMKKYGVGDGAMPWTEGA